MGYKVFVSYKFFDANVRALPDVQGATMPGDYVDVLEKSVLPSIHCIYKGEHHDGDLSDYCEDFIWQHLRDKIYDSTITIVMISPNMKEYHRRERSQWIPWEIQYSIRETTRNDRTSHRNAILGLILPDANGSYAYFDKKHAFRILRDNISNGYILTVDWDTFLADPAGYLEQARAHRETTPGHLLVKTI